MYIYKRIIKCPHTVEVEYYSSIRKVGKNYGGRGVNRNLTPAKQKAANEIRAVKNYMRVIDCNFCERDWFCRFSAPFGTFCDETEFMKHVRNFFERIKRRAAKEGVAFKYIGFRECGKLGKNWHMHIILSDEIVKIAKDCWYFKDGGMNFEPLYASHSYERLAAYIRKDISGQKRMMTSRNLSRPQVEVKRCSRKELRQLEKGDKPTAPDGFVYDEDESYCLMSDVTGCSWYLKYRAAEVRAFRKL